MNASTVLLAICLAGTAQARPLTIGRAAVGELRSAVQDAAVLVVSEAGRRAGIDVVFRGLPPARAIESVSDGEIDGEVARIADITTLYPNLITVPTPVAKNVIVVYATTPDIGSKTRAEIRRMRIGVARGQIIARKYSQGLEVTESQTSETLFSMLAEHRCDVVMVDYLEAEAYRYQNPTGALYRWPHAWATESDFLVLHKRHAALVPRLDAALQQMAREGLIAQAYAEGLRKYRLDPPPAAEPALR